MRGKAPINRHQAEEHGVTPACAGKSAGTGSRSGASWDHPPTVRGKERLAKNQRSVHGITPAYAGKRWTVAGTVAARWDHPRVCGEKASLMLASDAELGSPPRMRGKVREIKTGKSRRGITPAYAGKRRRCCAFRWLPWDHPRVCGEKLAPPRFAAKIGGSPPRMRGKDK